MPISNQYRGRIAPTPSGLLHLGHARTFAIAYKRAKKFGGKIILRIEDIDTTRCKKEYVEAAVDDLRNVGFVFDESPEVGGDFAPYLQSERLQLYKKSLLQLIAAQLVYPSITSRTQIKSQTKTLPKKNFPDCESEILFPKNLRPQYSDKIFEEAKKNPFKFNWRFKVPDLEKISFCDNAYGEISFISQEDFGDFLVWRKDGCAAYELAVCVDDAAMKISEVVRGADLLLSTARQILVYNALGLPIPQFYHCPILRDNDGKKLSKSTMQKSDKEKFLIRNSLDEARRFLL